MSTLRLPTHHSRQPSSKRTVQLPAGAAAAEGAPADGAQAASFYQSTGLEKAVALARYSDLMHTWWVGEWVAAGAGP